MKEVYETLKDTMAAKMLFPLIVMMLVLATISDYGGKEKSYKEFLEMMEDKKVETVIYNDTYSKIYFEDKKDKKYYTTNPKSEDLLERILMYDIKVEQVLPKQTYAEMASLLSLIVFVFTFYLIIRAIMILQEERNSRKSTRKKGGKITAASKNQKNSDNTQVKKLKQKKGGFFGIPNTSLELMVIEPDEVVNLPKFKDIAGNEEVKEVLQFTVDFLKDPTYYKKVGAKLPKGILLSGPPGTGKTMMAKAAAAEANVAFIPISGSDFVQEFVGVGAKRVRQVFDEARNYQKCIIFIDEFDAVAGDRNGGSSNSENRQTINALLDEMDGFVADEGIIVLAATNFVDSLDKAVIRPGRFDKKIAFALPNFNERYEILKIHARNKQIANNVDLKHYAKMTISMSGAYLATLLNEAAINAANNKREVITNEDLDIAYNNILMNGLQRKTKKHSEKDIRMVAMHEAGHVIAAKRLTEDDVVKATIISNTSGAGGYALRIPKEEGFKTIEDYKNDIRVSYAGRAAEQIHFNGYKKVKDALARYRVKSEYDLLKGFDYTFGATSDIEQATQTIMQMMIVGGVSSSVGMLNAKMMGVDFKNPTLLKEAKIMAHNLYYDALKLITDEFELLEKVANELMEKETLVESELTAIFEAHDKERDVALTI
ncbi:ATP-dependent metallopeptidase FtsH/Yme1/Tma family protein [Lysinibacillus sphaericus]|uniref:ATP-dependent metallopeptidase FtsH/Yme1/Tma family protein n=1 Tax=Lysinibacillus sphaericus TaxID=1421 RepID=UPI0018CECE67|nr:FtsH/Yme1/Tma family ATP-dependent metallopeptidase [Lysinibacillus sphaericus]